MVSVCIFLETIRFLGNRKVSAKKNSESLVLPRFYKGFGRQNHSSSAPKSWFIGWTMDLRRFYSSLIGFSRGQIIVHRLQNHSSSDELWFWQGFTKVLPCNATRQNLRENRKWDSSNRNNAYLSMHYGGFSRTHLTVVQTEYEVNRYIIGGCSPMQHIPPQNLVFGTLTRAVGRPPRSQVLPAPGAAPRGTQAGGIVPSADDGNSFNSKTTL